MNTAEDLEVAVVAPAKAQRVLDRPVQVNVFTKKATPVDSVTEWTDSVTEWT